VAPYFAYKCFRYRFINGFYLSSKKCQAFAIVENGKYDVTTELVIVYDFSQRNEFVDLSGGW